MGFYNKPKLGICPVAAEQAGEGARRKDFNLLR
jgi:hypothetical protein